MARTMQTHADMSIETSMTVASIVTAHPPTARVFEQYGIDFCCHGEEKLAAACQRLELSSDLVAADLEAAVRRAEPDTRDWSDASTDALIEHLLDRYHAGGYALMDQISVLMRKTAHRHGERWGGLLPRLAELWFPMHQELLSHFRKEEVMLFPMMRAAEQGGGAPPLGGPLNVMTAEHVEAGAALDAIAEHCSGFTPPSGACRSVSALFETLKQFDAETRRHIHLENHVLFPRFADR